MGSYVITIPGTVHRPLDAEAKAVVLASLRGSDPDEVGSKVPDLDVLTLDDSAGTFVLRLEVEAADRTEAGAAALAVATDAFARAGYDEREIAAGQPLVTGIDVG
ncbi:hypothetical protein [Kitasatospora sp. NPDC050543]|uniref:hypothetical protein n=1 Tax=Kitasatospora sp. NPDC050543 TaxID=3364054 RepID=UPI0037BC30D5